MIVSVLEDAGYAVAQAGGAAEALALIEGDTGVDLVLSDVVMPGSMDGLELARRLRRTHPAIAVVLVSGLPIHGAQAEGIGYLPKPFAMREVIALVERRIGPAA